MTSIDRTEIANMIAEARSIMSAKKSLTSAHPELRRLPVASVCVDCAERVEEAGHEILGALDAISAGEPYDAAHVAAWMANAQEKMSSDLSWAKKHLATLQEKAAHSGC